MNWGNLWGLYTLLMLAIFVGIAVWAWSGRRKKAFHEAAQIPLMDNGHEKKTQTARPKEADHD